jgi:diguanylate cyclase (GGDEF)-like protein
MFQIFACLKAEHDWRLVALAGATCLLASSVAINLFQRAKTTTGVERLVWLGLDAAAGGYGIWATHFIAMLAYDPGVQVGFDPGLTILSLIFASFISGLGLTVALFDFTRWAPAVGGAIVGAGIAAMHYTGMMALEIPGHTAWSFSLVVASIVMGVLFGGTSLFIAARRNDMRHTSASAAMLLFAIISHHFTAMGAVTLVPDPTRVVDAFSLSPASLSLIIAAAAAVVLGLCFVASLAEGRSQDKLMRQKRLLDVALENMLQGLCVFDESGRVVLCNDRYIRLTRLRLASLEGYSLLDLLKMRKASGDFVGDPEEFFARIMADVRSGKPSTKITETGTGRVVRVMEQPMQGGGWVATFEDITEQRIAQQQIAHLAHHDPLTGLVNRRKFEEHLEQALRRVTRNMQVAVLYLDLDRFKAVNDNLGHAAGDELLKQVAGRLLNCVREGDTVARLGGDEFAIVQASGQSEQSAPSLLAQRLIASVGAPYAIEGNRPTIGVSVGISLAPHDGTSGTELLRLADIALYRAKESGRGNYKFFEADMDTHASLAPAGDGGAGMAGPTVEPGQVEVVA